MKIVQFGAGNIGRSFLGQLFSRAGWETVFVDVNSDLIKLLNERRYYNVVIKREERKDEVRRVGPVRAVSGGKAASFELIDADLAAISVGITALQAVLPDIAFGLTLRREYRGDHPLNIIIAENGRSTKRIFANTLSMLLEKTYPIERLVGLVETSIGKMVPLLRTEDLRVDPLRLFAEEYEDLILDGKGFLGRIPPIIGLHPVDDIKAYVDRKLFIHNLGHAAAAYLSYRINPEKTLLAQALELPEVEEGTRKAMEQAASALLLEYPNAYVQKDLEDHIDDLLHRFKNSALGDTVHRVGRDLPRKLGREDRIVGALLLCARKGCPMDAITQVYGAALDFAAPDESGLLYRDDEHFRAHILPRGLDAILTEVSGLRSDDSTDMVVIAAIKAIFHQT